MIKKIAIALVIVSMFLAGCSASTRDFRTEQQLPVEAPAVAPSGVNQAAGESYSPDKSAYALDQAATSVERLVIKNATLAMYVNDPLTSMDTISKMADAMGGFVVTADMYQQALSNGAKVPQVNMTIRVPVEKLEEALATIKAETDQPIISENVSSQDVTADYTDLNSKLVNLEAAEKQLQAIMDSATKTEDVLAVYSQLVSTREQIEVIKGQMKYYEQSAALSAISVQLFANAAMQPLAIGGWQPVGVAKEALQSLINTLQVLGSFAIRSIILYIPTLLIIFVPIILIIWGITALIRKSRKGKKTQVATPEA